jgi:hypothetical protein
VQQHPEALAAVRGLALGRRGREEAIVRGHSERRHNTGMQIPRFWLVMMVLILIFVAVSMVIAVVKL